ncbi:MAG TPA: DUF4363 family protein [Firmicutes bacterium]|nr:DUF4363 family protein [Bacillota bacterium]
MKLLLGSAILIGIFLFVSIYITHQTLDRINQYRYELANLRALISEAKWSDAQKQAMGLQKQWNQIQDHWDLYIFHTDIENIEITIARMVSFINSKDEASALAELAALDMHFSHIYRNEMFNMQNVL